jgi:hypothetical protein
MTNTDEIENIGWFLLASQCHIQLMDKMLSGAA